ncbi:MAG: L,D-transpeptidase [Microcoleaceae cyanobacterium]
MKRKLISQSRLFANSALLLAFSLGIGLTSVQAQTTEIIPTDAVKSHTVETGPRFKPPRKLLPKLKNYQRTIGNDIRKSLPTPAPVSATTWLLLKLGERRVYVFQNDQEIASYPVAVGKEGWETPTGNFKVIQKVENPEWKNPWTGEVMPAGPNTALGLRWIGFWSDGENTIGFHGTPTVDSIGTAASHGCVRMYNQDVVALFQKVQLGTTVKVVP